MAVPKEQLGFKSVIFTTGGKLFKSTNSSVPWCYLARRSKIGLRYNDGKASFDSYLPVVYQSRLNTWADKIEDVLRYSMLAFCTVRRKIVLSANVELSLPWPGDCSASSRLHYANAIKRGVKAATLECADHTLSALTRRHSVAG